MSSRTWDTPVHQELHTKLTGEGYNFVESRYEGEIAVSKYRDASGNVKRVAYHGAIRDGEPTKKV